jgi:hypothetical protein
MLAAREVDALGGQAAVYRMRAAIRAGALRGFRDGGAVQGYAGGGSVYAQRQYAGTPQWSGGSTGSGGRGWDGPLVNVERLIEGTPQDVGAVVSWAIAGKVLA